MPSGGLKLCAEPNCGTLVEWKVTRCDAHQKARWSAYERRRPNRSAVKGFYASKAWRATRAYHLAIEPLCRECSAFGRAVPGEHVDHIIERDAGGDPFDHDNLRTLCKPCHSRVTMASNRAQGKL